MYARRIYIVVVVRNQIYLTVAKYPAKSYNKQNLLFQYSPYSYLLIGFHAINVSALYDKLVTPNLPFSSKK